MQCDNALGRLCLFELGGVVYKSRGASQRVPLKFSVPSKSVADGRSGRLFREDCLHQCFSRSSIRNGDESFRTMGFGCGASLVLFGVTLRGVPSGWDRNFLLYSHVFYVSTSLSTKFLI